MSCTTCRKKFSLFLHQKVCPNCGFVYCSKCLRFQHNSANDVAKICVRCHNQIEKKQNTLQESKSDQLSKYPARPIQNKCTQGGPSYINSENKTVNNLMDQRDEEIAARLERLRADKEAKTIPSEEELQNRLKLLKAEISETSLDTNLQPSIENSTTLPAKALTEQEQVDKLLLECLERAKLPENDPGVEIEVRLNKLRGGDPPKTNIPETFESDDEEEQTKKIIEKTLARVALDEKLGTEEGIGEVTGPTPDPVHETYDSDDSDIETCVLCDQTKNLIQCSGCYGDLYCTKCYMENHDRMEMRTHKAIPKKKTMKL